MTKSYDAVIVGAGPNGFGAGIVLAQNGLKVLILEAKETIGGGARTAELTLPGFRHDICSAIHPMGVLSPFLNKLPLQQHGLEWKWGPAAIAHPVGDDAAICERDVDATAANLGEDGDAYRKLIAPLAAHATELFDEILRPVRLLPRHPLLMARFGMHALRSAMQGVNRFRTEKARALFGGCAAHAILPLERFATATFGVVFLTTAHATGWPCAKGGSISIINALASYFASLGGEVQTGAVVRSMRDIPQSKAVIFDLTPRQLADIAGDELPKSYVKKLRNFRYGPGVFKIDYALDGPMPWRAASCAESPTVHVGGTIEEIARHESAIWRGEVTDKPFVLTAQQSLVDDTRAPAGKHTLWAYCHVPSRSTVDMTDAIESQLERFAPGFRSRVLAKHTMNCADYESYDFNYIGGDIACGANDLVQFVMRPFPSLDPYSTPNPRLFLGSSSTPPGAGVHGMCGFWAAQSALRRLVR
jgi:phytoene dehydrogenase-like protein